MIKKIHVGIIGLGYVGLSMLNEIAKKKKFNCYGFDIKKKKIIYYRYFK